MTCEEYSKKPNSLHSILKETQPLEVASQKLEKNILSHPDQRVTNNVILRDEGQPEKSPEEIFDYNDCTASDLVIKNCTIECNNNPPLRKPRDGYPKAD